MLLLKTLPVTPDQWIYIINASKAFLTPVNALTIYSVVFFLLAYCVLNGNDAAKTLITMFMVLFTMFDALIVIGLEPIAYFFFISELSVLTIIYSLSLVKKLKKTTTFFFSAFSVLLFCILLETTQSGAEPMFFTFASVSGFTTFNDFNIVLIALISQLSDITLLLAFVLFLSLLILFKFKTRATSTKYVDYGLKIIKDNMYINTKKLIKKWFNK